MIGKTFIRLVGILTCVAVVATGWDAEAARWHHRRACCSAPVCCEPVCCEPVCEPACRPACVTSCNPCCEVTTACCRPTWSYAVVSREVVIPAPACCASIEGRSTGIEVAAAKPAAEPAQAAKAAGSTDTKSVVKTAAVAR